MKELHEFLETKVKTLKYDFSIIREIGAFASKDDEILNEEIQNEKKFFGFILENGVVKSSHKSVAEGGKIIENPSFLQFNEDTFTYLHNRSQSSENIFLKIRYNQILWNSTSKVKSGKNAQICIDCYLDILSNIPIDTNLENELSDLCGNCCILSIKTKYKIQEVKEIVIKLLSNSLIPNHEKSSIIEIMLQNSGIFKVKDFECVLDICSKMIEEERNNNSLWIANQICEIAIKIAAKLSKSNRIWKEEIARNYENAAIYKMDDESKMIPLNLLQNALNYYQQAKNKEKIEEIGILYNELKKQLKLNEVKVPLDENFSKQLYELNKRRVDALLSIEINSIYAYLSSAKDIFPTIKELENFASIGDYSFMQVFTTIKFDINKNISKPTKSEEDEKKDRLFESYHQYCSIGIIPYLNMLFIEGIKVGKINYTSFVEYLKTDSWLGTNLIDTDTLGKEEQYNWLELIAPAIWEYFSSMEYAIHFEDYRLNLVTCIDSLTLKVEGILRNLAQLLGINTITSSQDGGTREMFMEDLFRQEKIQELIGMDEIMFFRFIFTSSGLNLRNNIAHCFFRFNKYSFVYMHLLIVVILRLSKFTITEKE